MLKNHQWRLDFIFSIWDVSMGLAPRLMCINFMIFFSLENPQSKGMG
jgi:hypothetical protein